MLPMVLWVSIRDEKHNFRLFIPLLLVYILLLPFYILGIIAYPFVLMFASEAAQVRGAYHIFFHLPSLFPAMRGTEVSVHSNDSDITMFVK